MKIKKFKNSIHIKMDKEDIVDSKTFYSVLYEGANGDVLFWNDIYVVSSDGWRYLLDTSNNKVCIIDNYGFDLFEELKTGKTVVFLYMNNDPDYEFNHE